MWFWLLLITVVSLHKYCNACLTFLVLVLQVVNLTSNSCSRIIGRAVQVDPILTSG